VSLEVEEESKAGDEEDLGICLILALGISDWVSDTGVEVDDVVSARFRPSRTPTEPGQFGTKGSVGTPQCHNIPILRSDDVPFCKPPSPSLVGLSISQ
jgi:hypothetical protein